MCTADRGPEVPIWEAWDLPDRPRETPSRDLTAKIAGPAWSARHGRADQSDAARPVAVRVRQLLDGHRKEHISNRSFPGRAGSWWPRTGNAAPAAAGPDAAEERRFIDRWPWKSDASTACSSALSTGCRAPGAVSFTIFEIGR